MLKFQANSNSSSESFGMIIALILKGHRVMGSDSEVVIRFNALLAGHSSRG